MAKSGKINEYYYLRDWWETTERNFWARRGGEFRTLTEARREARRLAKGIGKGARVQIVHVLQAVADEVVRK